MLRVYPVAGRQLRDYRTQRLVDPAEGVPVDEHDLNFRWLLDHGDAQLEPPPAPEPAAEGEAGGDATDSVPDSAAAAADQAGAA